MNEVASWVKTLVSSLGQATVPCLLRRSAEPTSKHGYLLSFTDTTKTFIELSKQLLLAVILTLCFITTSSERDRLWNIKI